MTIDQRPGEIITTRQAAEMVGLSIHRMRQLAPVYAERMEDYAGHEIWMWDADALAALDTRRKSPGSGKRHAD